MIVNALPFSWWKGTFRPKISWRTFSYVLVPVNPYAHNMRSSERILTLVSGIFDCLVMEYNCSELCRLLWMIHHFNDFKWMFNQNWYNINICLIMLNSSKSQLALWVPPSKLFTESDINYSGDINIIIYSRIVLVHEPVFVGHGMQEHLRLVKVQGFVRLLNKANTRACPLMWSLQQRRAQILRTVSNTRSGRHIASFRMSPP